MSRRPGSDAAAELFQLESPARFDAALARYPEAVALKAAVAPNTTTKGLEQLDEWWRVERPSVIETKGYLTAEELVRCVEWKLARGKFRPLLKLVKTNQDSKVRATTKEAFALAGASKPMEAVEILASGLFGVGPATATAVLAGCVFPVAFMADEALEGCGMKREYTLKACKRLTTVLADKAAELGEGEWTAELVGRALWAQAQLAAHGRLGSDDKTSPPERTGKQAKKRGRRHTRDELDAGKEPSSGALANSRGTRAPKGART